MRIISPPFKLDPGFEVDGTGKITGCKVQLLTQNERDTAQFAIMQKQAERLSAAQALNPTVDVDPFLRFQISQQVENEEFYKLRTAAFITEKGQEVTDRTKLDQWLGLVTEPDREEISGQQEELIDAYRRPKFRPKHRCGRCGNPDVECSREVTARDTITIGDVSHNQHVA